MTWRLFHKYVVPSYGRLTLLAVVIVAQMVFQLMAPQFLRVFIDGLQNLDQGQLVGSAAGFLGLSALAQLTPTLVALVGADLGYRAVNALRRDLLAHVLSLDLSFHHAHTPGELIERLSGDLATISDYFSNFVASVVGNALLTLGILVIVTVTDWRVGLAFVGFVAVSLYALVKQPRSARPLWLQASRHRSALTSFLEERLGGAVDLRTSGAIERTMGQLAALRDQLFSVYRKAVLTNFGSHSKSRMVLFFGYTLILGVGGTLQHSNIVTLGTVFLLARYAELLIEPLQSAAGQLERLQQFSASVMRIEEVLAESSRLAGGDSMLGPGPLSVTFDRVSFSYSDGTPVLKNVSFALTEGETLGLVGRTGSGKSTIARLMVRFYDPSAGTVALGGLDARQLNTESLRARVGFVTQDVQLFNTTLRDNLRLFNQGIDDQTIVDALTTLGLEKWLTALPDGLDTHLGGASGLSVGQVQLIALGRAFLHKSGLIVLDEATAHLDPATEALVNHAIARLLAGRTAVIVAHRLRTLERVDKILVLEAGRVVEFGDRKQLALDPNSQYNALRRSAGELEPA